MSADELKKLLKDNLTVYTEIAPFGDGFKVTVKIDFAGEEVCSDVDFWS